VLYEHNTVFVTKLFSSISVAKQHCGVLDLTRNIGHRTLPKVSIGTFLVQNVQPRVKTEFITTVKTETIHRVQGQFGSECPAICNHCGVMAALSRKT